MNLTRVWSGSYREVPGNFNISNNTLAPPSDRFVSPWMRSETPGALDGGNRFDLNRWNPVYFARLHDFLAQASRRNVVVEIDLFCTFYADSMWNASPLNGANNVNRIGDVPRSQVLSMEHRDLLEIEDKLVRKIVTEVNSFDNVYFEICNESYWGKLSPEWQRHISGLIVNTEQGLPKRHLISQNVANGSKKIVNPDPNVSIFNFHYSRPPQSVAMNYDLNRVIGNNETGFDGQSDSTYRIQGWAFLAAGGALYNNLDYSFTVGHESGDYRFAKETPGGGGGELRRQLGILARFFQSLDLPELRPAGDVIRLNSPDTANLSALATPGKVYIAYIYRAAVEPAPKHSSEIVIKLPPGNYKASWIEPKTGAVLNSSEFEQENGTRTLSSPPYSEDTVLKIVPAPS
ncbi:MAG: hypothetical protein M3Y57_11355 [Acidobacteriota bacterium]|nr:hypothetical protein [Acidobacteriota bacterium]